MLAEDLSNTLKSYSDWFKYYHEARLLDESDKDLDRVVSRLEELKQTIKELRKEEKKHENNLAKVDK